MCNEIIKNIIEEIKGINNKLLLQHIYEFIKSIKKESIKKEDETIKTS